MRARIVAPMAASTECSRALRMPSSWMARAYQSRVTPAIGHVATVPALNEYRTMIPIGT